MKLEVLVKWKTIYLIVGLGRTEYYFNAGPTLRCAFGVLRCGADIMEETGFYQRHWHRSYGK